jgi:hypothetical protein
VFGDFQIIGDDSEILAGLFEERAGVHVHVAYSRFCCRKAPRLRCATEVFPTGSGTILQTARSVYAGDPQAPNGSIHTGNIDKQ